MTSSDFTIYMAGFFDGEGYVGAYRTNYSGRPEYMAVRVIIGQKYPEVLKLARDTWGGSVYRRDDKRTGRQHYAWEIRGKAASKFVEDILPYTMVKVRQCKLVLEYQNILGTEDNYARKLEIQELIKSMNTPMGFGRTNPQKERIESSLSL